MKTSKEYRDFVVEQLSILGEIMCRPMMGEYLLYYKGTLFGGIYNDRLLIKMVPSNETYQLEEQIPYTGAKPMYLVDNLDDQDLLKEIIENTYLSLPKKK